VTGFSVTEAKTPLEKYNVSALFSTQIDFVPPETKDIIAVI
jgi:hypothetical protein